MNEHVRRGDGLEKENQRTALAVPHVVPPRVLLVSVPLVTTCVSLAIPLSYVREIGCDRPPASIYSQVKKKDFKWETVFLRKRWI